MFFPAVLNLALRAQSKSDLKSSETADAATASRPAIVPGLGALSGIVKTMGSGVGGAPATGFEGGIIEFRGKRI